MRVYNIYQPSGLLVSVKICRLSWGDQHVTCGRISNMECINRALVFYKKIKKIQSTVIILTYTAHALNIGYSCILKIKIKVFQFCLQSILKYNIFFQFFVHNKYRKYPSSCPLIFRARLVLINN